MTGARLLAPVIVSGFKLAGSGDGGEISGANATGVNAALDGGTGIANTPGGESNIAFTLDPHHHRPPRRTRTHCRRWTSSRSASPSSGSRKSATAAPASGRTARGTAWPAIAAP